MNVIWVALTNDKPVKRKKNIIYIIKNKLKGYGELLCTKVTHTKKLQSKL